MRWLSRFARSMLGQMALATALFVAIGVHGVAVRPMRAAPPRAAPDPLATTLAMLDRAMTDAVARGGDATALSARIDALPVVQQVQQRNPGFRYFALHGDVRVGTAAPRHLEPAGVAAMIAARRATRAWGLCLHWDRTWRGPAGIDHVRFDDCGDPRYHELRGIAVPIDVPVAGPLRTRIALGWSHARGFVLPALGVFAICAGVVLFHRLRIRRVAGLVRPPEPDDSPRPLCERGLPGELLPLVRAINRMIADGAQGERRRRFFLSAAAHEMRTPLTILRTRLEMLEESEDRTKLIADVRRLARLVDDLLTLTRIGERPPPLVSVQLFAATRRAVEALEPLALRGGVALRLTGVHEANVLGDAGLIETAASNLIGNALAATPPGGTVELSVSGDGVLTVVDTGPGIAPERFGEIFEPFVRLSDRHRGHGLGLAIVRAIADAHHAAVEVDSRVGAGTRFTIRFVAAPNAPA